MCHSFDDEADEDIDDLFEEAKQARKNVGLLTASHMSVTYTDEVSTPYL